MLLVKQEGIQHMCFIRNAYNIASVGKQSSVLTEFLNSSDINTAAWPVF